MFTTETDISAESLYRHKHINENNDNNDNGNNDKDFCIELYRYIIWSLYLTISKNINTVCVLGLFTLVF